MPRPASASASVKTAPPPGTLIALPHLQRTRFPASRSGAFSFFPQDLHSTIDDTFDRPPQFRARPTARPSDYPVSLCVIQPFRWVRRRSIGERRPGDETVRRGRTIAAEFGRIVLLRLTEFVSCLETQFIATTHIFPRRRIDNYASDSSPMRGGSLRAQTPY
jgi:hypothetical protein